MAEESWVILKLIMLAVDLVADICDVKSVCFYEIILYLHVGCMEEHAGKEENKKRHRKEEEEYESFFTKNKVWE